MKIDHIAMYVNDLEKAKNFFVRYFEGVAGPLYKNPVTRFQSYMVSFQDGTRLELMKAAHMTDDHKPLDRTGYAHICFCVGTKDEVDAKCKLLCCREVGEGSVNSASIPVRRVVELALNANATTVILAHNLPSGLALPSGDDIETTLRVARAMEAVEITLADHIVVADDDFVSLAQSGYYNPSEVHT